MPDDREPEQQPSRDEQPWLTVEQRQALVDRALARAAYFREQRLSGADPSLQYRI
ncbi:hypothetical protein [Cellulomonas triticagri]|uniref:hypothetical protein n=1 Tax=Cellulomonas triticagri TaxID=2483352 RepID=UPI00131572EA|nr:hypothetical protein [Cellulomonas triticagri]